MKYKHYALKQNVIIIEGEEKKYYAKSNGKKVQGKGIKVELATDQTVKNIRSF